MPIYEVQQGDCLSSIAARFNLNYLTIWNHPQNAKLKADRKNDPNVLFPHDQLFIPDKQARVEPRPTDAKHTFKKPGATAKLKLRILDWERPRKSQPYTLTVDGISLSGSTDGDGILEQVIPATAAKAVLVIGPTNDTLDLALGTLDPIDQPSGVQQRLNNLSYHCPVTGLLGDATGRALKWFQDEEGLTVNGTTDNDTVQRLLQKHGR